MVFGKTMKINALSVAIALTAVVSVNAMDKQLTLTRSEGNWKGNALDIFGTANQQKMDRKDKPVKQNPEVLGRWTSKDDGTAQLARKQYPSSSLIAGDDEDSSFEEPALTLTANQKAKLKEKRAQTAAQNAAKFETQKRARIEELNKLHADVDEFVLPVETVRPRKVAKKTRSKESSKSTMGEWWNTGTNYALLSNSAPLNSDDSVTDTFHFITSQVTPPTSPRIISSVTPDVFVACGQDPIPALSEKDETTVGLRSHKNWTPKARENLTNAQNAGQGNVTYLARKVRKATEKNAQSIPFVLDKDC